ncbi:hypothetical protein RSO68_09410 [Halomonas saccharevitans]|uniref:Beta-lactamase n=1 Tax=Halomonas saccharevitans TaxID=416872 RepID=A0ABU3NES7_9GAMM|nr:hypothetical protein [Halomonas saccharevitans]MDT8879689.1 hypothetical protein [Halomonas saccharevitans]
MPTSHQHTATTLETSSRTGSSRTQKSRAARSLIISVAVITGVLVSAVALAEDATRRDVDGQAFNRQGGTQVEALSLETLAEIRGRYARESVSAIDEGLGVILWDEGRAVRKGGGSDTNRRHEASGHRNHQSQTVRVGQ